MLLVLLLLLLGINLLQLRFSSPGSDHFVHFGIINSIKGNRNRFITKIKTYINDDDFPDPQLYHWLLSFVPDKILHDRYKYFGFVFNLLSFLFFLTFLALLHPHLSVEIKNTEFIFYCALIYVFTPFEYFAWNAKNVGLSARGFGLMFGHLFVYGIALYLTVGSYWYLLFSIIISYIVLLSSQFAFQFIVFFTLIIAFILGDIWVILIPAVSVTLFLFTFPRWSKIFFLRQWQYKRTYYRVLSQRFGLKDRYSIWRDFVFDFWTAIKKKGVVRGLEYVYRNPIIELLLGFPTIVVMLSYYITKNEPFLATETGHVLLSIIGTSFIIFLLTSFRKTRFLGEPQRYVEFIFPVLCILPGVADSPMVLYAILLPSVLLILFEVIGIKLLAKRDGGGTTTHEKTMELVNALSKLHTATGNKIASNNVDVLKYFAQDTYRILNINVTSELTGGIHFNDIFPEKYGKLALQPLVHLSRLHKIHWLILDNKMLAKDVFVQQHGEEFKEITNIHHYTIYRMC